MLRHANRAHPPLHLFFSPHPQAMNTCYPFAAKPLYQSRSGCMDHEKEAVSGSQFRRSASLGMRPEEGSHRVYPDPSGLCEFGCFERLPFRVQSEGNVGTSETQPPHLQATRSELSTLEIGRKVRQAAKRRVRGLERSISTEVS